MSFRLRFRCLCFLAVATGLASCSNSPSASHPRLTDAEQRTVRAFESLRANPPDLHAFLAAMPKGGDLHFHLVGAVYAETFIREGAADSLCVNTSTLSFFEPKSAACGPGAVPVERAYQDQNLYDAIVDAFSMRGFVPTPGVTGHDHFFGAFAKFVAIDESHSGEWVDEVATRAAAQNEQYLELMVTPSLAHIAAISHKAGWRPERGFADLRDQLLALGLRDDVAAVRAYIDQAESIRRRSERCDSANPAPACAVETRYLYQVLRATPPAMVFAQTLLGFEAASADPRVVGINYVQPEDSYVAMSDYTLHMEMVGFLHNLYPQVHISLHAGEIAPELVPPAGLCCHIRQAVEIAGAERIGHGVDVMNEDHPYDLLRELAAKHVMVEINLTSNDVILGIAGNDHSFPEYLRFGVPVALSTDDEGVSRIDLTHEYVRAVEAYGLTYPDLKRLVRTSIEHSFLPGASLWSVRDSFYNPVAQCSHGALGTGTPSADCARFLQSSERARQQWELERRFGVFESTPWKTLLKPASAAARGTPNLQY